MFLQTINYINLQLVLETSIAGLLLALPVYEKRKNFILWYLLSTCVFALLAFFFPVYSFQDPGITLIYWAFMYTALLFFELPTLLVGFRMNFFNALLITIASYLIHHVNNIFASIFTESINIYLNPPTMIFNIVKWTINAFVLFLTYFLFFGYYFRQRKENIQVVFNNRQLAFFATVVIIFTIVISSAVRIYSYWDLKDGLYIIGLTSNFASCFLLLIFFFVFLRHNRLQQELDLEKRMFEENRKQYELSKENIDSLNIKFHDLKYRVQMLTSNQSSIRKEDLKDIYEGLGIYDAVIKTGNKPLDIVLTQYSLRAENNHIKFTSIIDGKAISFMSDYDIYSLFGNAITNAIEATSLLKEEEKRHISLVMKTKGNIVHIEMENFFDPENLNIGKDGIMTSKKDRTRHGYGIKSMENIVRKYNGVLKYKTDNDIFRLTITFTIPDTKHDH